MLAEMVEKEAGYVAGIIGWGPLATCLSTFQKKAASQWFGRTRLELLLKPEDFNILKRGGKYVVITGHTEEH